MYVDIKYLDKLKFNNCENCYECCKKLMALLILEDFKKVYNYFPILIAKFDFLKPVMLLSNDKYCPYLKNEKCSIYENRPPACRIYPYSPWYDKILLDISCDGIGIKGEKILLSYFMKIFDNITQKIENTLRWTLSQKLKLFRNKII